MKKRMTEADLDRGIVKEAEASAENEVKLAEAQRKIVKILGRLPNQESRRCVANAVGHILQADQFVPGVIDAFLRGK